MNYKVIDLFCGAGGFSYGFHKLQFDIVMALDIDKTACETYRANYPSLTLSSDIKQVSYIPDTDIVIGGIPCQPFSRLNKNATTDERQELWRDFMNVVDLSKARMFIIENVAPFLKSDQYSELKKHSEELGFIISSKVINTADFGVPQNRKRSFIIAVKKDNLKDEVSISDFWPEEKYGESLGLYPHITVRDVISNLPLPGSKEDLSPNNLHVQRLIPGELSLKRYSYIPSCGNWKDIPEELLSPSRRKGKFVGNDLFGRLDWDKPSVTIRTDCKPEKGRYLHPEMDRVITLRECTRLMTFPDDFKFHGSQSEINKQIGNAVPPAFSLIVAEAVSKTLRLIE